MIGPGINKGYREPSDVSAMPLAEKLESIILKLQARYWELKRRATPGAYYKKGIPIPPLVPDEDFDFIFEKFDEMMAEVRAERRKAEKKKTWSLW